MARRESAACPSAGCRTLTGDDRGGDPGWAGTLGAGRSAVHSRVRQGTATVVIADPCRVDGQVEPSLAPAGSARARHERLSRAATNGQTPTTEHEQIELGLQASRAGPLVGRDIAVPIGLVRPRHRVLDRSARRSCCPVAPTEGSSSNHPRQETPQRRTRWGNRPRHRNQVVRRVPPSDPVPAAQPPLLRCRYPPQSSRYGRVAAHLTTIIRLARHLPSTWTIRLSQDGRRHTTPWHHGAVARSGRLHRGPMHRAKSS